MTLIEQVQDRATLTEKLRQEIAARGLRATRQRLAILEALRTAPNHPTAAEIHQALAVAQPSLSLKTVYDSLDTFVRSGLAATATDSGAPYRYEGNTAPHYHAQCRVCGSLFDVPAHADPELRGESALPLGFEIEQVRVMLLGCCVGCRSEESG